MGKVDPLMYAEVGECMTPGCKAEGGHGLFCNFCQGCADNLARIREEMKAEGQARMASSNNGLKKHKPTPLCCSPYCMAPRTPPAAFCEACTEAGYVEEDVAA